MRFKKIHYLTREFRLKFFMQNRYRTHCFVICAIAVFRVKFNMKFPHQELVFLYNYYPAKCAWSITLYLADKAVGLQCRTKVVGTLIKVIILIVQNGFLY